MNSSRTASIQQALLAQWSLAKASAESVARRLLAPLREEDYLRGFRDGYWRGAKDIAVVNDVQMDKSGLTH